MACSKELLLNLLLIRGHLTIGKPLQALQDGWLSVELLLWYVENPAVLGVLERFSNECRKTNTEAIKTAWHSKENITRNQWVF